MFFYNPPVDTAYRAPRVYGVCQITRQQLEALTAADMTVKDMATVLGVSVKTLGRRLR